MRRKTIALLLVATVALTGLGIFLYYSYARRFLDTAKENILAQIGMIHQMILSDNLVYEEIAQLCAGYTGSRVTILDKGGNLLADSSHNQVIFQSFLYDREMIQARDGQIGSAVYPSPITGRNTLHVAAPVFSADGSVIIIRVSYDLTDYDAALLSMRYIALLVFLVGCMLVAALFLGYLSAARPVDQTLVRFAKAVKVRNPLKLRNEDSGEGFLSQWQGARMEGYGLRELADEINGLLAHTDEVLQNTNQKYSYINTILGGLDSGLLAVDHANTLMLFNPQAEKLAGLTKRVLFEPDAVGPITKKILRATARVNASQRDETITLNIHKDLILEVHVSPIVNKYEPFDNLGALAVIKDVTQLKKLETLRSEFVANVSHELRTPLTLISGFIETLRNPAVLTYEQQDRALEIIGIETERLSRLISQLLSLSKIENSLTIREKTTFDLCEIIREAARSLETLAQPKRIPIVTKLPSKPILLTENAAWMRQIILNLGENAVKYTPAEGEICIRVTKTDAMAKISVKDTGDGIPKKDIPHIFERFYRVDKSRGSRIGGSGLGLSIAKHMLAEMGAEISVKSKLGKGSDFTITIPVAESPNR